MLTFQKILRFFGPELPPFQTMYLLGRTLKKLNPNVCPLDDEGRVVRDEDLYEISIHRIRKV